MDRVRGLLEASKLKNEEDWSADRSRVTVSPGVGARHQAVTIRNIRGLYRLTAVIAGSARAAGTPKRRRMTARLAWSRNAHSDLVTLGLDRRDRLVGRIRHPADHLDPQELEL